MLPDSTPGLVQLLSDSYYQVRDKLCGFPNLQFPHLYTGDNNSRSLKELFKTSWQTVAHWDKSSPLFIFVNKIVLKCTHTHIFTYWLQLLPHCNSRAK